MHRTVLAAAFLSIPAAAQIGSPLAFEVAGPGVWRAEVGSPEAPRLISEDGTRRAGVLRVPLGEAEHPFAEDAATGWVDAGRVGLRFPLGAAEEIYGLGLDFGAVRQNGRIHELGVDHWGGRTGRTHAPVAMWVSSAGYAVLVDAPRRMTVYVGTGLRSQSDAPPVVQDRNTDDRWIAHPAGDSVEVAIASAGAVVYVFGGPTPLEAVRRYVLHSAGGGVLPPLWGLGFHHRTPTRWSEREVRDEVLEFERRGFPLDVIGLEPGWQSHAYPCSLEWSEERFPDPGKFVAELGELGIRVNLWTNPFLLPGCALEQSLAGQLATHRVWNGAVVDFELPDARTTYGAHLARVALDVGASGFKVDEVDGFDRWLWPDTARFPSGIDGERARQTYGLRTLQLVDGLFRARDQRTWGLARATNAGGAGLPFVLYNDHYSHQDFIRALVNASFTGLLWTPEVRGSESGEEWLARMQTVCFSPLAMLNAWSSGTKPWSFPDVEDEVRETMLLRLRFLPYLYAAFASYRFDGIPPLRAMPLVEGWYEAADAGARRKHLENQWLVGEGLLVAPLFAGERKRTVCLPRGKWYDFHTGALVGGGEVVEIESPRERIPMFVREGSLIPLAAAGLRAPVAGSRTPLEVRHYGTEPGRATLYDDDGRSFAFERGEHVWGTLTYDGEQGTSVWSGDQPFATWGEPTWVSVRPAEDD
ncbi:MAG: glycoside hydrolase family 31 protein [bacterium]|nr:glycoside hydrolase family 31 protein [bacterium]